MSPNTSTRRPPEVTRITKELVILNENGMCARPTAEFVRCVNAFQSRINIICKGKRYMAHGIVDVLLANLAHGSRFTLEAEGPDAVKAVERIEQLLLFLKEADELAARSNRRRQEIYD